jgi:DNA polymerase III delta subunit
LKIALYALPGIAPCRLVHLYRAEKLVKENLELILAFLQAEHSHAVLVLEAEEWDARAKMRSDVSRLLKLTGTEAPSVDSVFKLMDVAAAGNGVGALRGLSNLFGNDEDPARLLGGMVWAWSNNVKRRISPDVYKKGLLVLQEADIALKRSHFPEREHVLEVAVVKLSLLVKPLKA